MTKSPSMEKPISAVHITKDLLRALAPLPAVAIQLMSLLDNPSTKLRQVADLASTDVGIASNVLRMANAPIFGLRSQVGSIFEALKVIGTVQARLLIIASGVAQLGQKELPLYGLAAGTFSRHSEFVATLTATFAGQAGYTDMGMAYSAGLFHDVGKVVLNGLARQRGLLPARALRSAAGDTADGFPMIAAEDALLGLDHAVVGSDLLALWALPEPICTAVLRHHAVDELEPAEHCLAACIALANAVAGSADAEYPALNRAPFPAQPIIALEEALKIGTALCGTAVQE